MDNQSPQIMPPVIDGLAPTAPLNGDQVVEAASEIAQEQLNVVNPGSASTVDSEMTMPAEVNTTLETADATNVSTEIQGAVSPISAWPEPEEVAQAVTEEAVPMIENVEPAVTPLAETLATVGEDQNKDTTPSI